LTKGWRAELIVQAVATVMARCSRAPRSLRYFEDAIAEVHAEHERPLPVATISHERPRRPDGGRGSGSVLATGGLGNVATSWSMVQTGDYNGDGMSDLLWRDTSGNIAMWFLNGTAVGSTGMSAIFQRTGRCNRSMPNESNWSRPLAASANRTSSMTPPTMFR
jgi:hypothetical protein